MLYRKVIAICSKKQKRGMQSVGKKYIFFYIFILSLVVQEVTTRL